MIRPVPLAPGPRARMARAGEGRLRRAPAVLRAAGLAAGLALAAAGAACAGQGPPRAPDLPSGQAVVPHDMMLERQVDGQVWLVLRYIAPRIARAGGDLGYEEVSADLDALCDGPGLAAAGAAGRSGSPPDQIVVTLMDRPVPWGATDPDATVFIGAYRPGPERCAWQ